MPYLKTTECLFGRRSTRSFRLAVVFSTMTAAAQNNTYPPLMMAQHLLRGTPSPASFAASVTN